MHYITFIAWIDACKYATLAVFGPVLWLAAVFQDRADRGTPACPSRSEPVKAMYVYLDSAPENITPELALEADHVLPHRWNGWLRPIATAAAFGKFLDSWRANDPNGIWGYVTEVGDTLVSSRPDDEEPADEFPRASELSDGTALYDLTGWAWIDGAGVTDTSRDST